MKKTGQPKFAELVVAEVVNVNPNSVFVRLKEYDGEAMIHISEVSSGWIRDIRHFVKIGQEIVAKVVRSDASLGLSMKRVSSAEKSSKLKQYRQEIRAEKMLEMAGQKINKTAEECSLVSKKIFDEFGSLYDALKLMIQKPQRFQGIVSDEWINALVEVAEKNIVQKEFELRAKFFIKTNASDGINKIKDVLKKIEKMKIGVHYIASPEYLLKYPTKDPKRGTKDFMSKLEKLNSESEGCDIRFELIQE